MDNSSTASTLRQRVPFTRVTRDPIQRIERSSIIGDWTLSFLSSVMVIPDQLLFPVIPDPFPFINPHFQSTVYISVLTI